MTSDESTEGPETGLDPFETDDDEPLPPRQQLGALGQLASGVVAVAVLIAVVLALSAVLTWLFH